MCRRGRRPRRVQESDPRSTVWCLAARGLRPGAEVTGTLMGADSAAGTTALALAIQVRDGYGLPFAVCLLGFLVSLLVVEWPLRLRMIVRSALLSRLLDRNDEAGDNAIFGLREWVNEQRAVKRDADLLPVVAELVRRAPEEARAARQALAEHLARTTLDPTTDTCPPPGARPARQRYR
jgi:hypothetical protein